ncbi:MAG: NUDIX hydrolase [Sphingobacteriales bacterium]|jgi:8-oxo-dGTP diphosphatase|nr:NUDIX hydrolase [Sphingobacteriales bacterium]
MKNKQSYFQNYVSVDCVVLGYDEVENRLQALLIKQKNPHKQNVDSFKSQYALPGDLIKEDESLDDAAIRVLNELTHIKGLYLQQFFTFGHPERVADPKDAEWLKGYRKDPNARVITIAYLALVRIDHINPQAGSFAENTIWRSIKKIPKLAFDHNVILNKALEIIKEHPEHHIMGRELLPPKFTLSQLQNLYEAMSNVQLDKRNFRKSIKTADYLIPLDEKQTGVLHKPAQFFSFKKAKK